MGDEQKKECTAGPTADAEGLVALVIGCAREVGEQEERPLPVELGRATPLFGREALFDSVGLVSLVVAVEQEIEDVFDLSVNLADDRAMSQERSPFRTVGTLADYAAARLAEARA